MLSWWRDLYVMTDQHRYSRCKVARPNQFNAFDGAALLIVLLLFLSGAIDARAMTQTYHFGDPIVIHLGYQYLPYYALRSVIRMLIALFFSVLVSLLVAPLAAKKPLWRAIIIPLVDVLQSVPVLGFLTISIWGFVALFPNSMLGPECASIFLVFTAQVWNMVISLYQGIITCPKDYREVARVFQLSPWQAFWKIEFAFALPSFTWNAMLSMSAGWFFVVASEAITVSNHEVMLPGIGSYIATAVSQYDDWAVVQAGLAMLVVIVIYHQLMFRPITYWVAKFSQEHDQDVVKPFIVNFYQKTTWFKKRCRRSMTTLKCWFFAASRRVPRRTSVTSGVLSQVVWHRIIFYGLMLWVLLNSVSSVVHHLDFFAVDVATMLYIIKLGLITLLRVMVLIVICTVVWLPIGVLIGRHARWVQYSEPLLQILSAFPANLFYPFFGYLIIHYHLNPDIWASPLMVLGTQWYILFNVIIGTQRIPTHQWLVIRSMQVTGWLWWRRFLIPSLLPYLLTGAMTATGGAWNASVIAEVIVWGQQKYVAHGLGAFISEQTDQGHVNMEVMGIMVMCLIVLLVNRLFWQPLYRYVTE